MDNLINNEFSNEEWISLSEPVMAQAVSLDNLTDDLHTQSEKKVKTKNRINSPIITFQLIIFICFLIFIFIIKTFFPDFFLDFKSSYESEISSSMISNGDFRTDSYKDILTATDDEAK